MSGVWPGQDIGGNTRQDNGLYGQRIGRQIEPDAKYKAAGQTVTPAVVQRLLWGLFPFVMVGANALFNISWGVMWPFMLILIGVSALVNQRS